MTASADPPVGAATHHPGEADRAGRHEEERWYAVWQDARNLLSVGDDDEFIRRAIEAYDRRPHRVEPLYDLAKHFREKGEFGSALIFAEAGIELSFPPKEDLVAVDEYAYKIGIAEEYCIAANYSKIRQCWDKGRILCDWLSLARHGHEQRRGLARYNGSWYAVAAATFLPTFAPAGAVMRAITTIGSIKSFDPTRVIGGDGALLAETSSPIVAGNIQPMTPLISFGDGYLAIGRESVMVNARERPSHRFVHFDSSYRLSRVSRRFFVRDEWQERVVGFGRGSRRGRLLISVEASGEPAVMYGVRDEDVAACMYSVERMESYFALLDACERGGTLLNDARAENANGSAGMAVRVPKTPVVRRPAACDSVAVAGTVAANLRSSTEFHDWAAAGRGQSGRTIGVVVPYRNREAHLRRFLPHLISYFRRDKLDHALRPLILVSEQADDRQFNRGFVNNVGFLALEPYCDYVCFHDVDYLPMWADYREPEQPSRIIWWGMHLRPKRSSGRGGWVTAPRQGLGTVTLFRNEHFRRVNGFSNIYQGWGFEDTDLVGRCVLNGLESKQQDGTFIPLDHDNEGFDEAGGKSRAWIENESRYEAAKARYTARGIDEGLTTIDCAALSTEVVEWSGLDEGETQLIGWLRCAAA